MRVRLAREMGFCFGVKRAVSLAEDIASRSSGVTVLGSLVHNPQVVRSLGEKGVGMVEDVAAIQYGTLVIPSHGAPPSVAVEARAKGLTVVDATCPFVRVAQMAAADLSNHGFQVIVLGDREHTEVKGIVAWANGKALVVAEADDLNAVDLEAKLGVLAQTTQTVDKLRQLVHRLVDHHFTDIKDLRVLNTVCGATAARQAAALELANEVSVIIVVGGRASANTRRLLEICQAAGCLSHQVEGPEELESAWFVGVSDVGVTAGASTPENVVHEVVERILSFDGADSIRGNAVQ